MLLLSGTWIGGVSAGSDLQVAFTFTPRVTHVGWTVTPAATIPGALQPQISPVPLAPTSAPPATPTPSLSVSGGDEVVGYDFLEGSSPPLWRIWSNGQEITVSPDDPSTAALLDEFRTAAIRRAAALGDIDDAQQAASSAGAAAGWGALALGGGVATALVSCAGVPFTFWAAGGTGWACAGGIAAAIGGGGAAVVSLGDFGQAREDLAEAEEERALAEGLADQVFQALATVSSP
jgi:hypothetical protein